MMNQFSLFDMSPSVEGLKLSALRGSYCADSIGTSGKLRKLVSYGGHLWACVSTMGGRDSRFTARVFRVVPAGEFAGETMTYNEKAGIEFGEFARNDPNGFYHGMRVKSGSTAYVLVGPEQTVCGTYTEYAGTGGEAESDDDDGESAELFDESEEDDDGGGGCSMCEFVFTGSDVEPVICEDDGAPFCPKCIFVHAANCFSCDAQLADRCPDCGDSTEGGKQCYGCRAGEAARMGGAA